jgi:putative phosphoesterase
MRVGLLSDTHDRVPAIAEIARRFIAAGVGLVLHGGDYCSPFSLAPFNDLNLPLAGVFGRNDGDHEGLRAAAAQGVGMELYESPHSIEVGGQRLLLVHDMADVRPQSLEAHSIIVHGGTHREEMKTRGETLIVNPGEACGWLYGPPSAAILDLDSKRVDFFKLSEPEWKW